MKQIFTLIGIVLFLFSCEKDVYYDFTENEKAMLYYKKGDTLSFLRQPAMDTINFKITGKSLFYSSAAAFITPQTYHFQTCEINFESNTGISMGIIAEKELHNFNMGISLKLEFSQEFEGQLGDTLNNYTFDGVQYGEVFVFSNGDGSPNLYYTKEKGIIYIENSNSLNSYTLIDK
jgi:hypothetical protein